MQTKFGDILSDFSWQALQTRLNQQTLKEVDKALNAEQLDVTDILALLSPAAEGRLELLAQRAQNLTRQRFGHQVNLFLPLYLSNLCANECTYCGFSMSNRLKRKTLNTAEIAAECAAITEQGFRHLLLVTGEHQTKVGMNYFRLHLPTIRPQFASVMMEVQPLATEEYRELRNLGLDGVLVYQETYHREVYRQHHRYGKKQNFDWRLDTPERIAEAGIDKVGLGVLIGLSSNWRVDCYLLALHLDFLQKKYWQTRFVVAFPRLRPCQGGIPPASIMSDGQLLQVISAFRIFAPTVEISLSTRESPQLRDNLVPIGVTTLSAGSSTAPGGYSEHNQQRLAQFSTGDNRSAAQVVASLRARNIEIVWKDWDGHLGRGINV